MTGKKMEESLGDLPRLQRNVRNSEFDIVVAASPENVLYLSDAFVSTQIDIRDRLALIAWDGSRDPSFVLCRVEEGYVRQESWITDIRPYKEFVTSPIDVLADVLIEMGGERGFIGLEMEYLAAGYVEQLRGRLPNARFGACEPIFDQTRMFKTPREREVLAEAFRGTEKALKEAFLATRPGDTERDMCYRLSDGILRSGA
ncbi:MAG: aminopeptidase P family N-terminal domain-containing protein, partial [Pseudomonadota bacterium]